MNKITEKRREKGGSWAALKLRPDRTMAQNNAEQLLVTVRHSGVEETEEKKKVPLNSGNIS
jgi:hypothetical protein